MDKKSKKRLWVIGKLLISGLLLYFVLTKVDLKAILQVIQRANIGYLFLGLVFFVISKLIAAFRLNHYFNHLSIPLTHRSNIYLYSLGMFYNLFLPGGIGGDAYKAYLLNKKYQVKTKSLAGALLIDRVSGLVALYILAAVFATFIEHELVRTFLVLILLSIPLAIGSFWVFNKKVVKSGFPILWKSLGLSIFVQLSQVICVYFILQSLDVTANYPAYMFIFLISSIVSVLPISIGGVGLREVTFLFGASYLLLNEQISVSISFVFFSIQALVSLIGVYFHFSAPKLKLLQSD